MFGVPYQKRRKGKIARPEKLYPLYYAQLVRSVITFLFELFSRGVPARAAPQFPEKHRSTDVAVLVIEGCVFTRDFGVNFE